MNGCPTVLVRSLCMKIHSAGFEVSAPSLELCPSWALPEFAFIGRSNVGKSSLINLLTERRELANVSDTPGKTKLINFFVINGCWSLVDLPGYGYARVGKQERSAFNEAVADFLEGRRNLSYVFVLIDSRLPPQQIDLEFLQWLEKCRAPHALVFTKADKQSATQTQAKVALFKERMREWRQDLPEIFVSSAQTKIGRSEILGLIDDVLTKKNRATG
jgi:GTP-binding protein